MKHFYAAFLTLLTFISAAQEPRNWVEGKLVADFADLEGIDIKNVSADYSTVTTANGYFNIWARSGDTIMVSAVHIKGKLVGLTQADLEKSIIFIPVQSMVNSIEEVRVRQYRNITAQSLGIVGKVKKYTPAERKLKTASEMSIGTVITMDPLINWISGRTAMLKKELAIERKESLMASLEEIFDREYIINKLKIPEAHVRGFLYYAVEDNSLASIVKSKNTTALEFKMSELAAAYNELISDEE